MNVPPVSPQGGAAPAASADPAPAAKEGAGPSFAARLAALGTGVPPVGSPLSAATVLREGAAIGLTSGPPGVPPLPEGLRRPPVPAAPPLLPPGMHRLLEVDRPEHAARGGPHEGRSHASADLAPQFVIVPVSGSVLPQAQPPAAGTVALGSLEDLLPALVRRIAWTGDRKRATVRMELGAGGLAGGAVLIEADEGGGVRVRLSAPPGADVTAWQARVQERLGARGLSIESFEID